MDFLSKFKILLYFVIFLSFTKISVADTPELTEVHKLLVTKDHLANLKTPTKIIKEQ